MEEIDSVLGTDRRIRFVQKRSSSVLIPMHEYPTSFNLLSIDSFEPVEQHCATQRRGLCLFRRVQVLLEPMVQICG